MPLKYTKEHEWVRVTGDIAEVGITKYASESLGTLVYVELPSLGTHVKISEPCGVVESAKSANDLFSPLSGEVCEVNKTLESEPDRINEAEDGEAWIYKMKISDKSELASCMDGAEYAKLIED